jgi:predicted ATPase
MLSQLSISHFKSFEKVDVPLRPLTFLIGKNDTGKSSFLRDETGFAHFVEDALAHVF